MSAEQLSELLDSSKFSESENEKMVAFFRAAVVMQEKERSGGAESDVLGELSSFNPAAWEKHIGVLMAAIVAVNISRKSSAKMSGVFTQLAYSSAQSQSVSILEKGEAAMWAATGGAVLATALSGGGAALSIKGQNQKHADIKTNKVEAAAHSAAAQDIRIQLDKRPANAIAGAPAEVKGVNAKGELETVELDAGRATLDSRDRVALEAEYRSRMAKSKESSMASELQESEWSKNIALGGTVSAIALVVSQSLSAILRMAEHSAASEETLFQADQGVHRAVSDAEKEEMNEGIALIRKLLEAIQQFVDARSAVMAAVATK
ncbi:hypothetical protein PflCFBP13517_25640 [Pseudomonas fluorescens]|nr:hypothetical protein PflCFBP13517_25640 [Pseudomonas fluorescens]